MKSTVWAGMLFAALIVAPGVAIAEIHPVAQLRQTAAGGVITTIDENVSSYDTHTAENFDAYDETSGLALRTVSGTATADGFAKQLSSISPTELTMYGTADAFVYAPSFDDQAYGGALSKFSLLIELDAPAWYRIRAEGFAQNNATAVMYLNDEDEQTLAYFDAADLPNYEFVLKLPAGTYSFSAEATADGLLEYGSGQPDGRSEISASLVQVPEPSSICLLSVLGLLASSAAAAKRGK